jgi:hypothetical protein
MSKVKENRGKKSSNTNDMFEQKKLIDITNEHVPGVEWCIFICFFVLW